MASEKGGAPGRGIDARRLSVAQLLPALDSGGVERGTLEIAEALVAAGHRSLVVSAGGRLVDNLEAGGTRHFELAIGEKHPRVLATTGTLARLLADEAVDIVHARSRLPAWIAWRALRRLEPRPAFVTTLHGLNSVSRYSAIMTRGDRVIAVSDTARDYWLGHYPGLAPERVAVIHRGVDAQAFPRGHRPDPDWVDAFREEAGLPAGVRVVCLPGRITRGKGTGLVADLLAALPPEVHGLLVGNGSPREIARTRRRAESLGVEDRLHRLPARSDIRDVMAFSDVVLSLSSKPESFGRTVAEALSLGRPVLGFDHGGVGEILRRVYPAGRVPPGDLGALVERAGALLADPPAVAGLFPYRLDRMQAQTLALYAQLAASP